MPSPGKRGRRALVVGGSMGGLFAGLMLRRAGWDVDIFEKVDGELSGRGAGIVAQPQIIAVLRELGLEPQALGVAVSRRRLLDADGRIALETDCPQVMTAWERLYRILRDGFGSAHYHRGRSLQALEQDAGGVTAIFADGDRATGDLLVGADGIRSTVRALFAPDAQPLYAGYCAWRALVAESALSQRTHRDIFSCMAFCLPAGEQMLGYPVAGIDNDLRSGHRRYNMVWYRPAAEDGALVDLLTDERGVHHPLAIPPPLIRRAAIADMRAAARRLLAPQFVEVVALAAQPMLQPIFDLESARLAFGRVALIGDAAFVARPHVGAGVAKAADDARAMVRALADGSDAAAALRRFEAERLAAGRVFVRRARHLGAYLQAPCSSGDGAPSPHAVPAAVLSETATLDFLQA